MTQLLISVTSIEEAKIAIENGVDIIDLKDPDKGALGALSIDQINSIVTYVNAQNIAKMNTSATIGDLPMQADLISRYVAELSKTKVDFIKIGFFEANDYQPCLDALHASIKVGVKLIAVLFAESTYPASLIEDIKQAGFIGVMLDTFNKNGLTLLDFYSEKKRKEFAKEVIGNGLSFGLAGSLKLQHLDLIKEINPTYIGFRGGVCDEDKRRLSLNVEKIKAIRKTL
ncbi:(5-formylfuran-3-yl)methyl phosphate synthase [Methylotenera sp.]|uniref:(5-formylfuran-3-yl)methyl phosphate synthase n=1 Tax=Methylotenera sp. TaxID=2051956 RepID=UPI002736C804|nr:(5-formylfuran-3-yl)methyl phosphate synthase [Methylotenera sp.]MDP3306702.1 (5-formylfuran-3-yl)methyl phosphate synthase [Methylotenera sp.]